VFGFDDGMINKMTKELKESRKTDHLRSLDPSEDRPLGKMRTFHENMEQSPVQESEWDFDKIMAKIDMNRVQQMAEEALEN